LDCSRPAPRPVSSDGRSLRPIVRSDIANACPASRKLSPPTLGGIEGFRTSCGVGVPPENGDKGCSNVGIGTRPKHVAQCRNPPLMDQHKGEFIAGNAEFSD